MKINRDNYEAFFLDHIERNLSPEMEQELASFLLMHPDLEVEMESLGGTLDRLSRVIGDIFPDKESLKKQDLPLSHEELEELLAKNAEGLLSDEEAFLMNSMEEKYPFITSSKRMYSNTFLRSEAVEFPDKKSLRFEEEIDLSSDEMLLVALHEGDLNEDQSAELVARLQEDKELSNMNALLLQMKLQPSKIYFENKDVLHNGVMTELSAGQLLLLSQLEGTITSEEQIRLQAIVASDDSLQHDRTQLAGTKLIAQSDPYPDKASLRKKEALVISLRSVYMGVASAAAVVVVLLWVNYNGGSSNAEWATTAPQNIIELVPHHAKPVTDQVEITVPRAVHHHNVRQLIAGDSNPDLVATSVERTFVVPSKLNSIDVSQFATNDQPNISVVFPKMKLIHEPLQNAPSGTSTDLTPWAFLSKVALEKIEGTYANSFVEKQVDKISMKTKEEVHLERTCGIQSDILHMKLGRFEVKSDVRKRKTDRGGIVGRIERLYDRIVGEQVRLP